MNIEQELRQLSSPEKAEVYARFFKTGKGEYGEGDRFIGLTVPEQRQIAKKHVDAPLKAVQRLLDSRIHEFRLTGLLILVYKFERAGGRQIVDFYLKNIHASNNWDLIDCIADKILGRYLMDRDKSILYGFARSGNLWKRRIAIITTFHFIRNGRFDDTLRIAEILLHDRHDLIHKAVGWMLREIGKRDGKFLHKFLDKHHKQMPRTMLRYAVERFPRQKQRKYLGK